MMNTENVNDDVFRTFSSEDIEKVLREYNDSHNEIYCEIRKRLNVPNGGCEPNFDSVLCWPQTPANTVAVLPCLSQLNGIRYDTTRK